MKTPETRFLLDFFAALEELGVQYAVLRNTNSLPESLDGSDLDMLVCDNDAADAAIRAAIASARSNNGDMTAFYRTDATVACFAGHGDDGWWGCHLDVFVGLRHYGLPYADARKLVAGRILEQGTFYRLGDEADVVSFVKEILYTGRTRKDYYPKAMAAYAKAPEAIGCLFRDCMGCRGFQILKGLLAGTCGDMPICAASKTIAKSIFKTELHTHPLNTFAVKISNKWGRLRRVFDKPGYCVAFLGTDGSGKSTLIDVIKPTIESMLHSKVHYEHLRPNLMPSLARLAGKPTKEGPTTNPHGGKVAGWAGSLVRFAYYYADYVIGYWMKIYPILVKRPTMVFFDRYYYEYMIDPRRCAVKLPRGWAWFWSWFIPKPDLILCLGGNPEKIYARKPETSLEEVERQVAALKRFCDCDKRAVWIDTTESVEASRDAALAAIEERMAKRYRR